MTDIVETMEWGQEWYVEIDEWGGCHFHYPEDESDAPLSLSPEYMKRVEEAREKVINGEEE